MEATASPGAGQSPHRIKGFRNTGRPNIFFLRRLARVVQGDFRFIRRNLDHPVEMDFSALLFKSHLFVKAHFVNQADRRPTIGRNGVKGQIIMNKSPPGPNPFRPCHPGLDRVFEIDIRIHVLSFGT